MIVGKQNIISWFENLEVPYWSLFAKGQVQAGTPIAKSAETDASTVADALASLKKVLDLQDRGQFTLLAGDKPSVARRGNFKIDFEIPAGDGSSSSIPNASPVMSGLPSSIAELDELTTKRADLLVKTGLLQMELKSLQKENDELKRDIKDLEKEAGGGMNKFWEAINKIGVDKIAGLLLMPKGAAAAPQAPPVTGVPETEAPPENDPTYTRLGNVIAIFQEADPDWLDTLERMAAKIKADPSVIKMFKKFL